MQLVNTSFLVTVALALASCARRKDSPESTLTILPSYQHPDTIRTSLSYEETQHFTIKTNLKDVTPHASIWVEDPNLLAIERREDVMIFLSRPKKYSKAIDIIATLPRWDPSKVNEKLPLILDQSSENLPKVNIQVKDGDTITVLLPMSKKTSKKRESKCRLDEIISGYIKSKNTLEGDKIDKVIQALCRDNTVASVVLRFQRQKRKKSNMSGKVSL